MSARTYSQTLHDVDAYTISLTDLVVSSPTSYHAVAAVAARLDAVGFSQVDERRTWSEVPARGYVLRDGAVIAWMLPDSPSQHTGLRILGAHTDSPALKLKPAAAATSHGFQLVNAEVYGGPLLSSFLDRELGLAGRLVTRDGEVRLVRTGPVARVAQVAPHLDRGVNESLHLDPQANLLPLWTLLDDAEGASAGAACEAAGRTSSATRHDDAASRGERGAVEEYLCELVGIDPADLAFHDVLTFPTEAPARFGRHGEFLASSRLDNLSSVSAGLVALEALAAGDGTSWDAAGARDAIVFVANDHEEVGSQSRSGAAGPFLEQVLDRLAGTMGFNGDARQALLARSVCVSADAGHSVHPEYAQLHDPVVQPLLNRGPLTKINARQRYATDAVGVAVWERACQAAGVPSQSFVSNNAVACGTTIGPITAARLGVTTVDIGQPLLSMHSLREMCGVEDGPWMAQAIRAYWAGDQA
ncbi:M18 family aminopeptidase [Actinomyces faecalis]|uniref:M18 family aminopeptidase n=1 Tax=Actinomyces faecalis TaxID=2722820 RepID=UPI0015579A3E|nr:M18 family aminopeptidase [Actinomyces faecalis]